MNVIVLVDATRAMAATSPAAILPYPTTSTPLYVTHKTLGIGKDDRKTSTHATGNTPKAEPGIATITTNNPSNAPRYCFEL
jgi:hypothetical protein